MGSYLHLPYDTCRQYTRFNPWKCRTSSFTKILHLIRTHKPNARPPIAATRTAASNPVPLTLKPTAPPGESAKAPTSPEPEAGPSPESKVEVGAAKPVDRVTGSDELLREVAEYGAEKV
jgi:hypothetical protein